MSSPILLIVGLGNPGAEYAETRHNAGAWLLELLAKQHHQNLRPEKKFKGLCAEISFAETSCKLLLPTTYMNNSGQSVNAVANFYHVLADAILVAHDDLDLPVGVARLKQGGGDGGHNGLRDITAQLHTKDYWRLRIGIGHPRDRAKVENYVLSKPSKIDHEQIIAAIETALTILPQFINDNKQKAIQQLHTQSVTS